MNKIAFQGRLFVLGCGGVSQCALPLFLKHLEMPADRITVMEMADRRAAIRGVLERGVKFVQEKITREAFGAQLARYVGPGDLIVDLAWNLGCADLLDWCHKNDVLYLNTSIELWDPYFGADTQPTVSRTLYARHMDLRKLISSWSTKKGATAVLDHGANPGLVSHFTRMALLDIAEKLVTDQPAGQRTDVLRELVNRRSFNELARAIGVKTIHISERDTQITNRPKEVNEFVNTWSVEGFFEEGTAPAEMGWGTHEKSLPPGARLHQVGPRNQICLAQHGVNTWVRSWVPCGEIVGMVIRHGEAFSISEALTVVGEDGHAVYRPTVHYAYCPCDAAIASLHELKMRNYQLQDRWRIMNDDIVSGRDELGCLLMGHDYNAWWIGSLLDIDEARHLVPGQNATTLQVAASVLGAVFWMLEHPHEGVCLPDHVPHEAVMKVATPYLGPLVSRPVDWMPRGSGDAAGTVGAGYSPGDADPWQFSRFHVI